MILQDIEITRSENWSKYMEFYNKIRVDSIDSIQKEYDKIMDEVV